MVVNDLFEKTEKIKLKICFVSIFNTNFILILKSTKIWLENIATLFSFSEMIALRIFYHAHFFLFFLKGPITFSLFLAAAAAASVQIGHAK